MLSNIPLDRGWKFRAKRCQKPLYPGRTFVQHMIDTFLYVKMLWSWICSNSVIIRIHASLQDMYNTACNHLPERTPDVCRQEDNMSWYDEPTFFDCLDECVVSPNSGDDNDVNNDSTIESIKSDFWTGERHS